MVGVTEIRPYGISGGQSSTTTNAVAQPMCPHCEAIERAAREFAALDAMIREEHPRPGDCEPDPATEAEEEFADMMFRADPSIAPRIGHTRTCPGCGRPQHYTGTEHGWAHDATREA